MKKITGLLSALLALTGLCSCEDDVSGIGNTLVEGEVAIVVDSLPTVIDAHSVYAESFDSRSLTKLLGRINVPEYGRLECSFVTQLMSATSLAIPDSIKVEDVDSMRMVLSVPRGQLTGDSLAPQQLRVYRLEKQLPSAISSTFDPTGYYSDASLLGSRSYTISNLSLPDSVYNNEAYVRIRVGLSPQMAKEVFLKYKTDPQVFQWPQSFAEYFPGLYVTQNFGNGCIANVSKAEVYLYWNYIESVYEKIKEAEGEDEEDVYGYVDHVRRDSTCVFASQPEVLSSNIVNYNVAQSVRDRIAAGDVMLTTPGGYYADMDFPVEDMLRKFSESSLGGMAVVSALSFQIPANAVKNDYGIGVAPYLLMVRKSEREEFFAKNKVPDGVNSFYAAYDSESGCYRFSAMRDYFLKVLEDYENGETIDDDDTMFSLVPVNVTLETVNSYNSTSVYVTRCAPYLLKPTLTQLHTDRSIITFTFSSQQVD